MRNDLFNKSIFLKTIVRSLLHSAFLTFAVIIGFNLSSVIRPDFWQLGCSIFTMAVVYSNIHVLIMCNSYNVMTVASVVSMILMYIIVLAINSTIASSNLFDQFEKYFCPKQSFLLALISLS